ncbi:MAG TPA: CHAT domain-containing protein [Polyangiaceae bacterium]|nr:CHAT domain-containing protein [Polyangiaceae bacterium]
MSKTNHEPYDVAALSRTFGRALATARQGIASLASKAAAGPGDAALLPPHEVAPRRGAGRIRILFLASNPPSAAPRRDLAACAGAAAPLPCGALALDEEAHAIEQALNGSEGAAAFELVTKWAVRCSEVQEHLLRHRPHVVHLSGHGADRGGIVLRGERGDPQAVSGQALEGLFKVLRDEVKVVLLNACWSAAQATVVGRVVGCAIGMRQPISDPAAVAFSEAFYTALGFGRTIREAFELGKNALELRGLGEADVPQLFEGG